MNALSSAALLLGDASWPYHSTGNGVVDFVLFLVWGIVLGFALALGWKLCTRIFG